MRPNQLTYPEFRSMQQSFTSEEGTLKYIDKGDGPVIVLLHGVPTSGWLYRSMIDELAETHRVIVPDMLGFGSSDSPEGYEIYSEENHAKRLLGLMNSLGVQTWSQVIHDAGGLWTWALLKQQPDVIDKLVILNTIIYEKGFEPPVRFNKGIIAKIAMWAYRNGVTTNFMIRNLLKSGLTENTLNKADVEGYKTPLREGKTRGMYYFFTQTCNELPNHKQVLQNYSNPAIVIWGENDSFLKWVPQSAKVTADLNLIQDDIHLIDAKHFIQEEKSQKIVAFIKAFVD